MIVPDELLAKLASLSQYHYYVERYHAGLKRLTVVVRPMHQKQGKADEVFITFVAVEYIQMPTYWEEAPFQLGTAAESRALMQQVGLEIVGDKVPHLFYAQLPSSKLYVLCWSVELSDTMPP